MYYWMIFGFVIVVIAVKTTECMEYLLEFQREALRLVISKKFDTITQRLKLYALFAVSVVHPYHGFEVTSRLYIFFSDYLTGK